MAVYSNFQGRFSEWEQFAETDRDHGREEKEYDEEYKFASGIRNMIGILKKEKRKIGKISQKACICLWEILHS